MAPPKRQPKHNGNIGATIASKNKIIQTRKTQQKPTKEKVETKTMKKEEERRRKKTKKEEEYQNRNKNNKIR